MRGAMFETRSTKPDLVLLDVTMPGESGLEGIPKLLHEHADMKILVLSMEDDPRYVREAFAAGASGYVLKEAVDAEVVTAIREVAGGGRYVHPSSAHAWSRRTRMRRARPRRTRSPTVSTRCCGCSRSATRTRRSRSSSSSPSGRRRRTART